MPDIPCGKCGSMNIGKNGTAAAGARNITAEPAIFTGHPLLRKRNRRKKEELTEKFLSGRVPQCGIARAVRVSRGRVIYHIKKRNPGCRIGSCEDGRTSDYRNG